MFKLILFESKKYLRSTFFLIMLLGLFLFTLGYYIFIHINTVKIDELITETEMSLPVAQNELEEIEKALETGEVNEDDRETIQRKEQLENSVMEQETLLQNYREENWTDILQTQIEQTEPAVESRLFRNDWYSGEWYTLFTEVSWLEYQKWMLAEEIRPVFPINIFSWVTYYDTHFQDEILEETVMEYSNKYSSSGVYFTHHLSKLLFSVFGVVFFLFLFGDTVTKEGLNRNGSIHLLQTQPMKRYKILTSKFITVHVWILLIFTSLVLLSLLLGSVFHYFGDWNYPVLIYGEDFNFMFMKMGTYLLQSFILFFMLLLFAFALLFFFSVLTKRSLLAVGLTLAVLFIGIEVSGQSVLSPLAAYIPFHYFQVTDIITQELALATDNFSFTFQTGVLVLGISTLIFLVLTAVYSLIQYRYLRN